MSRPEEDRSVLHLQLTCVTPPRAGEDAHTEFGVQDRTQHIHSGQAHANGSVSYDIVVPVTRTEDNRVRFRGPAVHGPPATPFLYLSLRLRDGEPTPWIRRLKIPLPVLTWDEHAATHSAGVWVASVAGTGSGTVPLLAGGWTWQATDTSSLGLDGERR